MLFKVTEKFITNLSQNSKNTSKNKIIKKK